MSGMAFAAYCGHVWRLTIHCALLTFTCCSRQHHHPTKSEFLADLLLDYNHQIPPMFERGDVCHVTVSVFINSVHSITEAEMEFTTDLIVEQRWTDERLDFRDKVSSPFFELDSRLTDRIWIPDLYFVNERQSAFREVSKPNKMLHIYRNGSVVYKARMLVTASCPMDLRNYPMDRQLCSLFIQSFGFSTKSLMFHWSATPLHTRSLIQLSHFTLLTTHQTLCDGLSEDGNFTCLQVDFYLQRHLRFYLLQVYMPSSLVVVMSWLSFWVHPGAVSGRTSLGILTVLTITKQSTMAISALPKVSYIKAVDVWMAVCLFFVFAAFLQYAVLCVTARAQRHKNDVTSCLVEHPSCPGNRRVEARLGLYNASTLRRLRQDLQNDEQITGVSVDQIDNISRVVFPAVYLLFVLVYFLYFNFDSF